MFQINWLPVVAVAIMMVLITIMKSYDICAGKVNETLVIQPLLDSGLIMPGGIVTSMAIMDSNGTTRMHGRLYSTC